MGAAKFNRIGVRSFRMMVVGVTLTLLAPWPWTVYAAQESGTPGQVVVAALGVVLAGAGVAAVIAGTVTGIIALVKKGRPTVYPLLAALGILIAFVVLMIELFIIWQILPE